MASSKKLSVELEFLLEFLQFDFFLFTLVDSQISIYTNHRICCHRSKQRIFFNVSKNDCKWARVNGISPIAVSFVKIRKRGQVLNRSATCGSLMIAVLIFGPSQPCIQPSMELLLKWQWPHARRIEWLWRTDGSFNNIFNWDFVFGWPASSVFSRNGVQFLLMFLPPSRKTKTLVLSVGEFFRQSATWKKIGIIRHPVLSVLSWRIFL